MKSVAVLANIINVTKHLVVFLWIYITYNPPVMHQIRIKHGVSSLNTLRRVF